MEGSRVRNPLIPLIPCFRFREAQSRPTPLGNSGLGNSGSPMGNSGSIQAPPRRPQHSLLKGRIGAVLDT